MMRRGLRSVLAQEQDLSVVGEAGGGEEAIAMYRDLHPDVVLMDLQMEGVDGLAAIRTIRDMSPDAAIVVITSYAGDARITRALASGARSYLLKASGAAEILRAIRAAAGGRQTLAAEAMLQLSRYAGAEPLTSREIAVLRLASQGYGNRAIAQSIPISEEAVKSRMRSILSKLGADDRTHAVSIARERGFLDP